MNTKMKVLSLALIGAFGYVGSAAAGTCPAGPDVGNGGAWTAAPTFQGTLAIATPGFASTSCRLDSAISAGAGGAAFATVQDDTPAAEPRYRAQFSVDVNTLANQSLLAGVQVFSATAANGATIWMSIFGDGAGAHFLGYFVKDADRPSGVLSGSTPLAAGVNVVEFDLQVAAAGSIALWVNNNVEGTPTVPAQTVNNAAAVGIDTAFLGLASPTPQYVTAFPGTAVGFDQFDSRRQTFIGF